MEALHYSYAALLRRSGFMMLAMLVVLGDQLAHADAGFPCVLGFGPVVSATILATVLYLAAITTVMMLSLVRHGGVAASCDADGVFYHTAWTKRRFAWSELSNVALDMRYTRSSHYVVVAIRRAHALQNCFTIDTRLLAETIDQAGDWTDAAERQRVAQGGAPYVAPTGLLAGWSLRDRARDVAAARVASRA